MTDEPVPPRRPPMVPLMDCLGELCRDGKEAAGLRAAAKSGPF